MQPESASIFESRYERRSSEMLLDKATGVFLTDPDSIKAIEKLCDELAQAKQALTLHAEIRALNKARIEEQAGTLRVLSRMITDSLDATSGVENGACPAGRDSDSAPAPSSQSADSSAAERPDDRGEAPGFDSPAASRFEFATGEGRTLYMNVPCSRDDAQTTARVLGLALGKHVIAREA